MHSVELRYRRVFVTREYDMCAMKAVVSLLLEHPHECNVSNLLIIILCMQASVILPKASAISILYPK